MPRTHLILLAVCVLTATSGCRNRCGNQCGGGLFAGSPTISAPPTYSLNIPSVASNQPYYVPGQTNQANASLTPTGAAPTAASNSNPAQLNGWRPINDNNGANLNQGSSGQSVMTAPTTFAQTTPGIPAGYRTASNTALPGSGTSYTASTNYQTTRVDETQDQTRLPVTDASNVRAPARNNPTGAVTRFSHIPQPTAPLDPRYPATFTVPASAGQPFNPAYRNAQGNPVAANGQPIYMGTPMVIGNGGYATQPVYTGQPFAVGQGYRATPYTSSSPAVLAQSTTTFDPTTQVGWRDRENNSDSFSR